MTKACTNDLLASNLNNWEVFGILSLPEKNVHGREVERLYEGTPRPSLKRRVRQFIGRVLSGKKWVDGQR